MPSSVHANLKLLLGAVVALVLLAIPAAAFPPAPHHTIFGLVRDEYGRSLHLEGASVIFSKDGVEVLRRSIQDGGSLNQNYLIRLRMDMRRPGTTEYSDLAQNPGQQFTLAVLINDILYHPIEMTVSDPTVLGQPGERVRIDLTLGEDSDGDGIPDAWEKSQLYAAGILPDGDGWQLNLLDKDGDFDGDQLSNWGEYIAGTYATDPTDIFSLQMVERQETSARLRFFGILDKVYSLESSTDLNTWTPIIFYFEDPDFVAEEGDGEGEGEEGAPVPALVPLDSYRATSTEVVEIYSDLVDPKHTFYRLRVR